MIELYKAYPDKEKYFDYTQSKQMGNIDFRPAHYFEGIEVRTCTGCLMFVAGKSDTLFIADN